MSIYQRFGLSCLSRYIGKIVLSILRRRRPEMYYSYLSDEVIAGFDKYKYSAVDTSPLSQYVTHPFWNWVVKHCIPKWLAPNLMTLTGYLFFFGQIVLLAYYDWEFYAASRDHQEYPPLSNWVYFVCALCIFLSHTLDGCDGKQARRTNTSSPLGELFDHGLDSSVSFLAPICLYSIFGRGEVGINVIRTYFTLWAVMACFIMSHWEKYNTGILFLPWGYDVGQISMAIGMLVTSLWSYSFWKFTVTLPILNIAVPSVTLMEISLYFSAFGVSIPMTLWNVYISYRNKTGNCRSLYEAMRPLAPNTILFISFSLWALYSPNNIIEVEPRLYFWATGTTFSYLTCHLIISQMSKTRCDAFNWVLLPVISIPVFCLYFNPNLDRELTVLLAYTILITSAWLHFGICVVKQMADHFNIYVFSVEKKNKD